MLLKHALIGLDDSFYVKLFQFNSLCFRSKTYLIIDIEIKFLN